jgi:hypothetical protein
MDRFVREFRHAGFHLLRSGDLEPFERFFAALDACSELPVSPSRDRQLYLDCRRFLVVVERGLALVTRRAEILGVPFDMATYESELARFRMPSLEPAAAGDDGVADHLLAPPGEDDEEWEPLEPDADGAAAADSLTPQPEAAWDAPWGHDEPTRPHRTGLDPAALVTQELPPDPGTAPPDAATTVPGALLPPDEPAPAPPPGPEPFDPDLTRRIWRDR